MKRLVLFFDGTWNKETEKDQVTNIVRLKQLVEIANTDPMLNRGVPQRIFYDRGVGTGGLVDRVLGGGLGVGLSENVKQGYRFLSQFYEGARRDKGADDPDRGPDQIHVFGFSRGAFTARSLAGFVAAAGLLRKDACDEENLERAWRYYRTPVKERMPAEKAALEYLCTPDVRITVVGVFDTVGSLGIPTGMAGNWVGSFDHFHDTKLGSSIDHAFHALALDEHRSPFVPALFARPDHMGNKTVEQAWFPGVHSDIGGGYAPDGKGRTSIADLSLHWMVARLRRVPGGLCLADPPPPSADPADSHDSLGWFVLDRLRPMYRLIDGLPMTPPPPKGPHGTHALRFPDISWHERVHRSVLDLMIATSRGGRKPYRPPQILAAVPRLLSGQLQLAGFDGTPMDPVVDVEPLLRAAKLL